MTRNASPTSPVADELSICLFPSERVVVLRLSGRLSVRSAASLREALAGALAMRPADVIVDLAEVTAADSAAAILLPAMQRRARRHGARLHAAAIPDVVSSALSDLHIEDRIRVHDSVAAAAIAAMEQQ